MVKSLFRHSDFPSPCLSPLTQRWILRILVKLQGHRNFLRKGRFVNDELATALGLEQWLDTGNDPFIQKEIFAKLRLQHARIEKQKEPPVPSAYLEQNLSQLARLVGLSPVDCSILAFAVLVRCDSLLESASELLVELPTSKLYHVLAILLDHSESAVRIALSNNGAHIPRNRKVTAQELHEQLRNAGIQRELRTIQRQLESLCEHFDIECDDRSKPYGYKWKEFSNGFSLPTLSEQECLLLALAQRHLQNLLPASVLKSMEPFFRQAQAQLDPLSGKGEAEKEWLKKIKVVSANQPLLPPKLQPGVFEAVSTALYKNQWLDIDYRNASGKRQSHSVMPLGLAQQGERLYLVCRYKGYDNERSLVLHRILSATASGLPFERPADFDLQRYEDDGRFSVGNGQKITLSFTVTKKAGLHLLESPLSTDQKVVEHDGAYAITATVVDSLLLNKWLRGFGNDISHVERIPPCQT